MRLSIAAAPLFALTASVAAQRPASTRRTACGIRDLQGTYTNTCENARAEERQRTR
jgi:hypothetical protein